MSGDKQAGTEDQRQPNDSEPSPERQVELEAAYEANIAADNPPYYDVKIRTRGELRWVIAKRQWSGDTIQGGTDKRIDLTCADLESANLSGVHLISANLAVTWLHDVNLTDARLVEADLSHAAMDGAKLSNADLTEADLTGAILTRADLTNADLTHTNLTGADLSDADLTGTNLYDSRMDVTTSLAAVTLSTSTCVADVIWNGTSLTRISWEELPRLGDEAVARQSEDGIRKKSEWRLAEYQAAARSYRQLAVALRDQGLNEDADRYAYRAQLMQRIVLRRQAFLRRKDRHVSLGYRLRKLTGYLGSGLLDLIAGYGYRPGRSLLAYILIILTFAGLYLLNGQFAAPHLRWDEALVLSVSSFHGRGFFTTDIHLGDTLARLAAGEAIVGLLIEITFIATFTQRFFGK